jgi:hypothetical protein
MLPTLRPTGSAQGSMTDCITGCSLGKTFVLEKGKYRALWA